MTTQRTENLGPAERIINALLNYTDHMVHNRPGVVVTDARSPTGVKWEMATTKVENSEKVAYRLEKVGKKSRKVRVGIVGADLRIHEGGRDVGRFQEAGIFPEVAAWMYSQVAEIWKLDNEFVARWASYAFGQEHRDLKVVLAAFLLVQSRKGDPVTENGKVLFHDEDFRAVGEAMVLLTRKDNRDFSPKLVMRVREVLHVPAIAKLNYELGFAKSDRRPFEGRWPMAAQSFLRYREENPKMLEGLVKAGMKQQVMDLASWSRFRPTAPKFFELLRWKQRQADEGHRQVALDMKLSAADTWDGLSERQICERIVAEKPNYKLIVGKLPRGQSITRAIMAAAIEAGALSDKDLIIATPTLEELGLLEVQDVKERWSTAVRRAEDMRAANIAERVKSQATKEKLQEASDNALKSAVAEVTKNLRVYVIVDISASMQGAIEAAKSHIARFLQGFPLERLHVSVFNTTGREIRIQHSSAAGVAAAFRGVTASGGTAYGHGVRALSQYKPQDDEDSLFIFIGDEEQNTTFEGVIRDSGLRPMAFGLIRITGPQSQGNGAAVQATAARLGVPCFLIDERTFADPYAIPRTIRTLVQSTPVGRTQQPGIVTPQRATLVEQILKTDLLQKPAWA